MSYFVAVAAYDAGFVDSGGCFAGIIRTAIAARLQVFEFFVKSCACGHCAYL